MCGGDKTLMHDDRACPPCVGIDTSKKFPERIKTVKTNPVIEKTQAAVNTEIDKFLMKKKIYV